METLILTAGALGVGGAAAGISGRRELIVRWRSWLVAAPLVLVPLTLFGHYGGLALAVALGTVASWEYARMLRLPRADAVVLALAVAALPALALFRPVPLAAALPVLALVCALPALFGGDTSDGGRRAASSLFGVAWIGGGLTGLVLLDPMVAIAVCAAVSFADVAAWCGGRLLGRRGPGARALSPLSPAKTWGGVAGAAVGATVVLAVLGQLSVGLLIAVVAGGVLGDLLESMVKREAGAKDAGSWLPGFGGLLDRVDSLLVALPLAVLVVSLGGAW